MSKPKARRSKLCRACEGRQIRRNVCKGPGVGRNMACLWNSLDTVVAGGCERKVRVDQDGVERGWEPAQGQEFGFS